MEFIETEFAPPALGHYSQGIVQREGSRLVFTSMQLPLLDDGSCTADSPIEEQLKVSIKNAVDIVRAGGGDGFSIIKLTLYISDMSLWDQINEAYKEAIGSHKPARSVVGVSALPKGYKIAIEAIGQTAERG